MCFGRASAHAVGGAVQPACGVKRVALSMNRGIRVSDLLGTRLTAPTTAPDWWRVRDCVLCRDRLVSLYMHDESRLMLLDAEITHTMHTGMGQTVVARIRVSEAQIRRGWPMGVRTVCIT